jgi:RNA polymerase sigma factor (TIGR02999 family)
MSLIPSEITRLLEEWSAGNDEALGKITTLLYEELRRMAAYYMRGERSNHTLQATALVHEAYMKLDGFRHLTWNNRQQFIGIYVKEMRRILVDHARKHKASKRGGGMPSSNIDALDLPDTALSLSELIVVDEALNKLATLSQQQYKIFDARFFGGLTIEETAKYLGISKATVERGYAAAKAFISRELDVSETTL